MADFVAGRGSTTAPPSSYVPGVTATDVGEVLAASGLDLAPRMRVGAPSGPRLSSPRPSTQRMAPSGQCQQGLVLGHQQIGRGVEREFEKFLVVRILAARQRAGRRGRRLMPLADRAIAQRHGLPSRGIEGETVEPQHMLQFGEAACVGDRARRAILQRGKQGRGGRIVPVEQVEYDVGVEDQAHCVAWTAALGASLSAKKDVG